MLTLDEAITRFKAGAVANRSRAESYNRGEDYEMLKAKSCEICADECDQVASWLTELLERREADRWIPVSEMLPEEEGDYLIQPYKYQVTIDHFVNGKFCFYNSNVTAWRPLPEPYKESELKPTKDLINDIVGFDVSGIKPLPEYKESEGKT